MKIARRLRERAESPRFQELWRRARADVAVQQEYHGLRLSPHPWLVPAGKNPESLLWEFDFDPDVGSPGPGAVDASDRPSPEVGSIRMVLMPGGTFVMGSVPPDEARAQLSPYRYEVPHRVTLSPFFLAKFELTLGQLEALYRGCHPETSLNEIENSFERVTRPEQLDYPCIANWSTMAAIFEQYPLSFPTEAQWEYGCRAGSTTAYSFGDDPELLPRYANVRIGAGGPVRSRGFPFPSGVPVDLLPVGLEEPNPFGLYDVHGNVAEWCLEQWVGRAYVTLIPRPGDGSREILNEQPAHIARGGSIRSSLIELRSAARMAISRDRGTIGVGVRPALALP